MKRQFGSTSALAALALSAAAAAACAADYEWLPVQGGGAWETLANWQTYPPATPATQLPGAADVARFVCMNGVSPPTPYAFTLSSAVDLTGLNLARKQITLDVQAGASLTITGTATASPQLLALDGTTLNVAGTVTASSVLFNAGRVNGTVTLPAGGAGVLKLGSPSNVLGGQFLFLGDGDVAGTTENLNGVINPNIGLTARATAAVPAKTLRLLDYASSASAYNYGTITLDGDGSANNSSVTLTSGAGAFNQLANYATLNLNAGGTGTNTRTISGSVFNNNTGTINVAARATGVISQLLDIAA